MKESRKAAIAVLCLFLAGCQSKGQALGAVTNQAGVRMQVATGSAPALRILLPGQPDSDPGIVIILPEHVTARARGSAEARHLYLSANASGATAWRRSGTALEYTRTLDEGVVMTARATLEPDGTRYEYEFRNTGATDWETIQAVTDPRMETPVLHDVRLERTYIHRDGRFELLAVETPARTTEPLAQWLPNRYRAPYSWPIESRRMEKQDDGLTWYNTSFRVDEPFLATVSTDGKWVMATFAYDPGNVWTNPELTCQHADASTALPRGATASHRSKTLLLQGGLEDVLRAVRAQRESLR